MYPVQADVAEIVVQEGRVAGVVTTWGQRLSARAVVLCSGTFMRGLLHVGMEHLPGGRLGGAPSHISDNLAKLGFPLERFKTGTSPRIKGSSIDFSSLTLQPGMNPAFVQQHIPRGIAPRDRATLHPQLLGRCGF